MRRRRKPGLDVRSRAGSAWDGRAYLVVARLHAVAVPGACSHSAECIFPVVVPAAVAATKLRTGHGMINVAALHVLTTVTNRGRDAWVGACGSQAKLTTTNTVCIIQAEVGRHRGQVEQGWRAMGDEKWGDEHGDRCCVGGGEGWGVSGGGGLRWDGECRQPQRGGGFLRDLRFIVRWCGAPQNGLGHTFRFLFSQVGASHAWKGCLHSARHQVQGEPNSHTN